MTFDEVLAAARGLTADERWSLIEVLEREFEDAEDDAPDAESGTGYYLTPPCRQNGWTWEAPPELLTEMQRLLDEETHGKQREAS